uniref:Secreted protein n=1 Tax=Acrobeloides nanus TaxID=290746 RepID=A0A914C652_9BILA
MKLGTFLAICFVLIVAISAFRQPQKSSHLQRSSNDIGNGIDLNTLDEQHIRAERVKRRSQGRAARKSDRRKQKRGGRKGKHGGRRANKNRNHQKSTNKET